MTLKEINKQINELRLKGIEAARDELARGIKDLFEKYPEAESFSWQQYTPYFNDGDECTFSVRSDIEEFTWGDEEYDYDNYVEKGTPQYDFTVAASKLVSSIDDEYMRSMFGDHVKVVVSRDGISTEEYSHE